MDPVPNPVQVATDIDPGRPIEPSDLFHSKRLHQPGPVDPAKTSEPPGHNTGNHPCDDDDNDDPENTFPEGGLRAWLVVAGSFMVLFPTFGLMVAIGTFQDYWSQNQLSAYTTRDVGWIPSVFVYISLALGIWVGPLFDRYGPRRLLIPGGIGYVAMWFLLAECSAYWQIMLCVGGLAGVTSAFLTTTALSVVAHWFKERRGLAQGIAMIGSSTGGLVIPIVLREAIPRYGYPWAVRILAFIAAAMLLMGNLLIRARIPPSRVERSIISVHVFADLRLGLLTASVFLLELVLFGALGLLPTYATMQEGYPPDTGFYLIAVMNGASCLGRLGPGYFSDKFGRFNTLLVMIVFTLVWMLVLWLPLGESSLGALYAFAALFGFGTGSWMALIPACIGQLCKAHEFGRYYGSVYFIASLATLICMPIGGEFLDVVGTTAMAIFWSAMLAVCVVIFTFARWACLHRRWVVLAKV